MSVQQLDEAAKEGGATMSHRYLYGVEKASVRFEDVNAPWKSDMGVGLLNRAFKFYYDAYNATSQINDPHDPLMQRGLRCSLDKAAKYVCIWPACWSFGKVSTLVDGFEHLDKNDGHWTDDNECSYNPSEAGGGPVNKAPACATSFFTAVDSKMKDLGKYLGNLRDGLAMVKEGEPVSQWEKVGKGLEVVEKYSGYAKPLLWLAPETLEKKVDSLFEWEERFSKIYGCMSQIMKINTSDPASAVLFGALVKVLEHVPVLGSFYGQIVAEIPGMAEHWESFSEDYWAKYGMQTFRRSKNRNLAPMFGYTN
jgi:hypothetical protein